MDRASDPTPRGPITRPTAWYAPVFRRSTWAFAFKRSFGRGTDRNMWAGLFFGTLLVPAGILLAVTNYRRPVGGLLIALIGAPMLWYWLCGRPGDRRDPVALLAHRHERVTGALTAAAVLLFAAWCGYRSWQLAGQPGLHERVMIGCLVGLLIVVTMMGPLLLHARLSIVIAVGLPGLLVFIAALPIDFPRWSAPVPSDQAWAFPIVGMVMLAVGLFVAELVRRGTYHLRPMSDDRAR